MSDQDPPNDYIEGYDTDQVQQQAPKQYEKKQTAKNSFVDLFLPKSSCQKLRISGITGKPEEYTAAPDKICLGIVTVGVMDALLSFQHVYKYPFYTSSTVVLDFVSCFLMLHHCNTCNAWEGFFKTLMLEMVGKIVIRAIIKSPSPEETIPMFKRRTLPKRSTRGRSTRGPQQTD